MNWRYLLYWIVVILAGCVGNESDSTIQIDKFIFQFPRGYYAEPTESFNADNGIIKSGSDTLIFKYEASSHVRPPVKTAYEYLGDRDWEVNVDYALAMKFGVEKMNQFKKSELQTTENSQNLNRDKFYYVTCSLDTTTIDIPVIVPAEILNTNISRDTFDGFLRETYIPREKGKGVFGVYIRPLRYTDERNVAVKILSQSPYGYGIDTKSAVLRALQNFVYQ